MSKLLLFSTVVLILASCKDCGDCFRDIDPLNGKTMSTLDSLAIAQGYSTLNTSPINQTSFDNLNVENNNSGVLDYKWNEYCDEDYDAVNNFEESFDIDKDGVLDLHHYWCDQIY